MANATVPYRTTARPATRPSVDELEKYLADHTIDQASRRYKVHPRTIHKWRARADTPQAAVLAQDERNTPTTIDSAPTFSATADDRAGDNTMWRDPWTGDLLPVPPGVHRKAWEAERIAARDRHKAAVHAALAPVPEVQAPCPTLDITSSQAEETAPKVRVVDATPVGAPMPTVPTGHSVPLQNIAQQSHETTVPGMPMYRPLYAPMPERVRIVRLPAEPPRRGVYDRLADLQVESIMGPELGTVLALLLILVTFWGLG